MVSKLRSTDKFTAGHVLFYLNPVWGMLTSMLHAACNKLLVQTGKMVLPEWKMVSDWPDFGIIWKSIKSYVGVSRIWIRIRKFLARIRGVIFRENFFYIFINIFLFLCFFFVLTKKMKKIFFEKCQPFWGVTISSVLRSFDTMDHGPWCATGYTFSARPFYANFKVALVWPKWSN